MKSDICDMINRHGLDVRNINFELQAEEAYKVLRFILFRNFKVLLVPLQPHLSTRWSLNQSIIFKLDKSVTLNIKSEYWRHVTNSL